VATRADIEINVKGLKKVQELSKLLDKVSGKVNQLNQGGKSNKLDKESVKLQEDKRASMIRVRNIGDKIAIAKERGLKVDKASRALDKAALLNDKGEFTLAKAKAKAANELLKTEIALSKEDAKQLRFAKLLAAIRGSGAGGGFGGGAGRGGGGFGAAISSAAVSGAFPLLFGQGPAAAAGGFGGGLIGSALGGPMGGFAGGLIGTTVVSTFQEQVLGLANALDPLNADIDAAIEKVGGLSSARQEEIKIIEEFRGKQAALKEITKDLTKVVGEDGVEAFRELRESAKLFTNNFSNFALKTKASAAEIINNLKEFFDPGGLDLGKAQAGLESINDPTIDELNTNLKNLQKELQDVQLNLADDLFGGIFAVGKLKKQDEIRENITNVKDEIKLNAAKKAGAIIEKQAGAELRNQQLRTREQLNQEQRLNEIRTEGRFVISKGLAEEILALEKANQTRLDIFENQRNIAQNTIKQLEGSKNLSIEDEARLERAKLTVESIDAQVAANERNFEVAKDLTLEQRKLQNAANESVDAFERLATTIQNDIKNGIKGLIRGTSTLGDLLNNVADRFLDMGLNALLFGNVGGKTVTSGLFGLLGFANGGRPPVGKPSIVGEKGPELFVPKTSGTVIPNDKLGGGGSTNISVNVDASGSSVQGNNESGKELGRLISVAIQSELLKQRRPGGLLR
tara:strand:+ start:755 stop:2809 length:2055 start_codon:yes stop_codon:yes gene_type:complete